VRHIQNNAIQGIIMIGATGVTTTTPVGAQFIAPQANMVGVMNRAPTVREIVRQYIVVNPAQLAHDPENTPPTGGIR
jgi:hypothetical protein